MTTKDYKLSDLLKYEAKQFCLNTALHGYRFIILPKRTLLERIFWIIVVVVSFIVAFTLLLIAWSGFQQNPTSLVTDSTHHPIWNYPFPAVTICNYNKLSKNRTYQLAQEILKTRHDIALDDLLADLRIMANIFFKSNNESIRKYARVQDLLESIDLQVPDLLYRLAPKCEETLQRCKWKGEEKRCESIFELIPTSEGYCCAFNYFALKNHTFGGILPNKIPKRPHQVAACGYLTALEVLVNLDTGDYFSSQIASYGHRIVLHDAYHFPDWAAQSILNQKQVINMIGMNPKITYSSETIRTLPVEKRQCLFPDERQLHNFQYNFHNCMVECRMNISKRLCNCIEHFHINPKGTYPKANICNLRDIPCLIENHDLIASSAPGYEVRSEDDLGQDWHTEVNECGCIQDCEYVQYVAESSLGFLSRQFSSNQQNLFGGIKLGNQSVVRVYFNDLMGIKNRRDVSFSWHTLLAYYGGLLGLFIGFSFVSGVEVVYFFTIRLLVDIYTKHTEKVKRMKDTNNTRELPKLETLQIYNLHDSKLRRRSSNFPSYID